MLTPPEGWKESDWGEAAMSDPNKDDFDADYWFEMYQGQCATTDEWAKKYHDEVERKADATLLARCAELQRIAEVANAMVGKSRDQIESQAKRIAELEAEVAALRLDAGRYRWIRNGTSGERFVSGIQAFVFPAIKPVGNIMRGSVAQHLDEAIDAAKEQQ